MRGSFTSPKEVRQAIDAFVTVYSENARPFEWRNAEARQTTPLQKYADAPAAAAAAICPPCRLPATCYSGEAH